MCRLDIKKIMKIKRLTSIKNNNGTKNHEGINFLNLIKILVFTSL
jgi:hypothetical protein